MGHTLGRYKLLERVGDCGCGVVYVAEQTEPGEEGRSVVGLDRRARPQTFPLAHTHLGEDNSSGERNGIEREILPWLKLSAQLDGRRHYAMELNDEFPLSIKLFRYTSRRHTRGATWHERLELFLPLDGQVRFRMGEQEVELQRGDLLVVDNLKLHHVIDFPGFDTRVVVISFLPEFVYSLGSPSHDYAFLLPFYSKIERRPHVLRAGDTNAPGAHDALTRLLECYFAGAKKPFFQAGAKAFLLELLFHLATQFRGSEVLQWEFMRQQERSLRLRKLFQHISERPSDKLPVQTAARLAGMSATQFMKTFKQVAGMTLVAYLNHVRLAKAARLLRETGRSIADISSETGFSDQSYFDKRFKRAFGRTPKKFRAEAAG